MSRLDEYILKEVTKKQTEKLFSNESGETFSLEELNRVEKEQFEKARESFGKSVDKILSKLKAEAEKTRPVSDAAKEELDPVRNESDSFQTEYNEIREDLQRNENDLSRLNAEKNVLGKNLSLLESQEFNTVLEEDLKRNVTEPLSKTDPGHSLHANDASRNLNLALYKGDIQRMIELHLALENLTPDTESGRGKLEKELEGVRKNCVDHGRNFLRNSPVPRNTEPNGVRSTALDEARKEALDQVKENLREKSLVNENTLKREMKAKPELEKKANEAEEKWTELTRKLKSSQEKFDKANTLNQIAETEYLERKSSYMMTETSFGVRKTQGSYAGTENYLGTEKELEDLIKRNILGVEEGLRRSQEDENRFFRSKSVKTENGTFITRSYDPVSFQTENGKPVLAATNPNTFDTIYAPLSDSGSSEISGTDLIALGFDVRLSVVDSEGKEIRNLSENVKAPGLKDFVKTGNTKIIENHFKEFADNPRKLLNVTNFVIDQQAGIPENVRNQLKEQFRSVLETKGHENLKMDRLRLFRTDFEDSLVKYGQDGVPKTVGQNASTMIRCVSKALQEKLYRRPEGMGYAGEKLQGDAWTRNYLNLEDDNPYREVAETIGSSVKQMHDTLAKLPKVGLTNSKEFNNMLKATEGFENMEDFRKFASRKSGKEFSLEEITEQRLDTAIKATQDYVNAKISERLPRGTKPADLERMRSEGKAAEAERIENRAIQKIMSDPKVSNRFYHAREMLDRLKFAKSDLVSKDPTNKMTMKDIIKKEAEKQIADRNQKAKAVKERTEQLKKQQAERQKQTKEELAKKQAAARKVKSV